MNRNTLWPIAIGAAMGLAMLKMLHVILTGPGDPVGLAPALFVRLHVVVIAAISGLCIWAGRVSPRLAQLSGRLHRPRIHHVLPMATGGAGSMALTHLILHGGL